MLNLFISKLELLMILKVSQQLNSLEIIKNNHLITMVKEDLQKSLNSLQNKLEKLLVREWVEAQVEAQAAVEVEAQMVEQVIKMWLF